MDGTIALCGGGPFAANDDLDRRLLQEAGADRVVVLPTADAFEHPEVLVTAALGWGERLDVEVEAVMVLRRGEALEVGAAATVQRARAVWLVGDNPLHLRSVLKDTPLWDAVRGVLVDGGVVAGVAGSAAALCDPMTDPRGGAFTLGLGLVKGLAVATEVEAWSDDQLHRTRQLADVPLALLSTGAALLRRGSAWEMVGDVELVGELPSGS